MEINKQLKIKLKRALEELGIDAESTHLEHPANEELGDYSTNVALVSYPQVKDKFASPYELAEAVVREMSKGDKEDGGDRGEKGKILEKIEIAGPGFINFTLSPEVLVKQLEEARASGEDFGSAKSGNGKTMVLDHSHPNIAKRFGIGHLRSTIIGQALINLYRFQGWSVIGDNFLGDWGTQFGSIIAALKEQSLDADKITIDDLEKLYVDFNKRAKENPELWEQAKLEFKKLEDGDLENRGIWQIIKKVSLEEFEKIWGMLGVKFDAIHGESFFEDKISSVLADAKTLGVSEESQGALIVKTPGSEIPLMLMKSDGATTYETRDLAAIKFWAAEHKPDVIAYEVGSEQALHFRNVFQVAGMLGYISPEKLIHIQHGLYLSPDGKKMRTRTGQTVKLEEVLEESVKRARKLVNREGDPSGTRLAKGGKEKREDISTEEKENIAKMVGIGAIKYFDLSHHHESNIVFDWENVFQMEGNSAPYLQYTYARCQSVLAKAQGIGKVGKVREPNQEERALLRCLYRFPEVVESAAYSFSPNLLCNFLFDLAQRYNTFYNKHRILSEAGRVESGSMKKANNNSTSHEPRAFRLALTEVTGNILKTGLGLLGILAPGKM